MNYKIAIIAFSITLFLGGCASMNQQGRIGKNDGSDPCFRFLESIDSVAMYYKDERLKQLLTGVAVGTATGAALGLGTASLADANLALGAVVGGIAGGIAGAFVANSYWDNRMQQANQQASLAANNVKKDLREDIQKISSIDSNISGLVRCRTQQRDKIRSDFAARKLTEAQAELEWQTWAELVKKDQAEMQYLGEALDNIQKIEESYNYAATMIDSSSRSTVSKPEKGKKSKRKHKKSKSKKSKGKHAKSKQSKKVAQKSGKITALVSSMHEKYESIKKNKNDHEKLAMDANNPKGFERIESHFQSIDWIFEQPSFLSEMLALTFSPQAKRQDNLPISTRL